MRIVPSAECVANELDGILLTGSITFGQGYIMMKKAHNIIKVSK